MNAERVNWAIHKGLLGLAAAALVAFVLNAHVAHPVTGIASFAADLLILIGAVGLGVYALVTTLALRQLARVPAAVAIVHGGVIAFGFAGLYLGSAFDRLGAARDEERALAADPAGAALIACVHVRALVVETGPRRARVTLESVGCPPFAVRLMRLEALEGRGLRLFGSGEARVDVAPGATVNLETEPRSDGPLVDARTEWQLTLSLAPPSPTSVGFRTRGVRAGSRLFGAIERVEVSP